MTSTKVQQQDATIRLDLTAKQADTLWVACKRDLIACIRAEREDPSSTLASRRGEVEDVLAVLRAERGAR